MNQGNLFSKEKYFILCGESLLFLTSKGFKTRHWLTWVHMISMSVHVPGSIVFFAFIYTLLCNYSWIMIHFVPSLPVYLSEEEWILYWFITLPLLYITNFQAPSVQPLNSSLLTQCLYSVQNWSSTKRGQLEQLCEVKRDVLISCFPPGQHSSGQIKGSHQKSSPAAHSSLEKGGVMTSCCSWMARRMLKGECPMLLCLGL